MFDRAGQFKEEALVVRSIRHSESSRIFTLFGKTTGKMAVLGKGSRRAKGGGAGAGCEPPSRIEAIIYAKPGRGVQNLGTTTILSGYDRIRNDLNLTAYAAAIQELLVRSFTDGETNEAAFNAAVGALELMEIYEGDPRLVLWRFILDLISALGFEIDLFTCPVCGAEKAPVGLRNPFWVSSGAVVCRNCTAELANGAEADIHGVTTLAVTGESVSLLRTIESSPMTILSRLRPSPHARREISLMLESYLRYHHPEIGSLPAFAMIGQLEEG